MKDIGITGNREGFITDRQQDNVIQFLLDNYEPGARFHHGDCIGIDVLAAFIAKEIGYYIIGHIPENDSQRGFFDNDEEREPKPYLVRNKDIVNESEFLMVVPGQDFEVLRSGTWSTYRYAKNEASVPTQIFYPNV